MPHTLLSNRVKLSVVPRGEYQLMSLWMGKKSLPLSSRKRIMTLNSQQKMVPLEGSFLDSLNLLRKLGSKACHDSSKLASENKLNIPRDDMLNQCQSRDIQII